MSDLIISWSIYDHVLFESWHSRCWLFLSSNLWSRVVSEMSLWFTCSSYSLTSRSNSSRSDANSHRSIYFVGKLIECVRFRNSEIPIHHFSEVVCTIISSLNLICILVQLCSLIVNIEIMIYCYSVYVE